MGTGVERPTTKAAVQHIFRTCAAVCFDVDSTAVVEEGIDVLAAHCGAGEVVAAWTAKAMGGSVPFDVALQERLKLIQPSAAALADVIASHPLTYSPGVQSLVAALKRDGKRVFLVSGGFRQMIEPVADGLGIAREDVVANRLFFNEDGSFAGFDRDEPTSRSGGKAVAIGRLKAAHGLSSVVMVGDGATDAEACPPADAFIGYGGVVEREAIKKLTPWYVLSMAELEAELTRSPELGGEAAAASL
ncbi:hypothetical protein KFE25_013956 [Diacronema lutheri]|uniref:phosphoserine phosphatase n=1 Tax=Diacronema lutheri TaxID=2081491 RepID=A0A8J5XDX0_DIALT|nr:hypothetical protein KFE25_013956 [Diacronema lutheri]